MLWLSFKVGLHLTSILSDRISSHVVPWQSKEFFRFMDPVLAAITATLDNKSVVTQGFVFWNPSHMLLVNRCQGLFPYYLFAHDMILYMLWVCVRLYLRTRYTCNFCNEMAVRLLESSE